MLYCINAATIDKTISQQLNTANLVKRYVYWNAMTDFISI